ncbi:MAG: endonuclease/exonuclease/phosphatase family protein [Actinomycetota bacterium]
MRIATYKIHAGVDGWGREYDVLPSVADLDADLLFVQELFRGPHDQYANIVALGLTGVAFASLAHCDRVTGSVGGRGWQPLLALLRGDEGLYFSERAALSPRRSAERDAAVGRESGEWGVGLFTKHDIVSVRTVDLPQLTDDRTARQAIIARLHSQAGEYYAVAIHGAHLSHGSLGQYRILRRILDDLGSEIPIVLAGDFNCWRPLLRLVLPGWRSSVRRRTWPAWRPHSQIDHILLRGSWRVEAGASIKGPSDHRALIVDANFT